MIERIGIGLEAAFQGFIDFMGGNTQHLSDVPGIEALTTSYDRRYQAGLESGFLGAAEQQVAADQAGNDSVLGRTVQFGSRKIELSAADIRAAAVYEASKR